LTGFLIGISQGLPSSQVSRLQKDALFSAVIEKDVFIPRIRDKIRDGEIDKATGEQIIAKVEEVATRIGNIPENITVRDKSEMLTLMEERIRLKVQAQDADLGEAFKKANETRIEEIDAEMSKIINREPVEAEPEIRQKEKVEPAEDITDQRRAEHKKLLEAETVDAEAVNKLRDQVKKDVEQGKIVSEDLLKELELPTTEEITKEAEAAKPPEEVKPEEVKKPAEAEPVKEVKAEEITREDQDVDTKVKSKSQKEIAETEKKEKDKVIKEEGEPLEETEVDKDIKKIQESDTVDDISKINKDLKEENLNSPQDFADRINKTVDNIRKAQAVGAPELPGLRDISDKVLTDIKKKVETAKNFEDLKTQFERIEVEIEKAASREIQGRLLVEIKKEIKITKAQAKGLSPQVNAELKAFKTKSSFKNPETLKAKRLEKTSQWFAENPGQPIPERIVRELEELDKTNLTLLSNRELKSTLDDIRLLKTQGKTFNRLKLARVQRERSERVIEFNEIITGKKAEEVTKPVLPEAKKSLNKSLGETASKIAGALLVQPLLLPITVPTKLIKTQAVKDFLDIDFMKNHLNTNNMIDILEENAKGTPYQGKILSFMRGTINKARDSELFGVNNKLQRVEAKLKELNISSVLGQEVEIQGQKVSRNTMLDIFISSKDPAKLASMKDMKNGNKFSQKFIDEVVKELTPEEKAFGEWAVDFYGELYNEFNQVFRQVNFTDAPKNKGYSPMVKRKEFINKDEGINLTQNNLDYAKASIFKPFAKERQGSKAAIELDAVGILTDYITRTEHYKAFELPIQEINATVKGMANAIRDTHGQHHLDLLNQWVKDVASDGRYKRGEVEKMLKGLRLGFTKGVLGFNLVTAIKQTISLSSFLTEINEVDITKGLAEYWNPKKKKQWDEFMDTIALTRFRGKTMERDIADIEKSRQDLDRIFNVQKLGEKSLNIIRGMDRLTVRSGFVAAYKAKGGKLGEPINDKALEFATGLIERTQPRGDVKDLSAFQKGSELTKLLTMFMNQPNQYFNVQYANIRAYNQGRIGKGQLARTMFYSWIVPSIAFETISKGGTPDEDDIISAVVSAPLRNIFFVSSMVEAMRTGFDFQASPIENIPSQMVREAQNFQRGEVGKALYGLGFLMAQAKGLPVTQLERSVSGVNDILNGTTDD